MLEVAVAAEAEALAEAAAAALIMSPDLCTSKRQSQQLLVRPKYGRRTGMTPVAQVARMHPATAVDHGRV